jgi:hypothetical protein
MYVVIEPLLDGTGTVSQAETSAPAEPAKVHVGVPVGATPPEPVTVKVKAITELRAPVPDPAKIAVGVTWLIITEGEDAAAREE